MPVARLVIIGLEEGAGNSSKLPNGMQIELELTGLAGGLGQGGKSSFHLGDRAIEVAEALAERLL